MNSKILRSIMGVCVILLPILFGWFFRNPWVIPILGAAYVPLYILGKMGAWTFLTGPDAVSRLIKAVPGTFVIQCLLAGFFYLIGAGLGSIFGTREMAPSLETQDVLTIAGFALIMIPLSFWIAYNEQGFFSSVIGGSDVSSKDDAKVDFDVLPQAITTENFFSGWHYSRMNYTQTALKDIVDHKGEKPKRAPKRASEAMIAAAEDRLGVRFPETLRALYKMQDGGSLPTYFVPKYEDAPHTNENWVTAFAHDYDELVPLAYLRTLHTSYMEYFNPEYDDPSLKDDWLPDSEKLVVIAAGTGYGTALDYRGGSEPGVVLFDHNGDDLELLHFDSFDVFMAALREVDFDYGYDDAEEQEVAFGTPPNPLDADRFWENGNTGPGVSDKDWAKAGEKLGVTLPDSLLPFYKAANGGTSIYSVAVSEDGGAPLRVFPKGPYVSCGQLLKLDHIISLATLSDRLDFVDNRTP
ncbi:SMI1/KNR4 family protein [Paracoccaceae bacterium GXU_MW_L88]